MDLDFTLGIESEFASISGAGALTAGCACADSMINRRG